MRHVTSQYPPPLSSPPTVETLERLLAGLTRPHEQGVPTPPVVDLTDDVLFAEERVESVVDEDDPARTPQPGTTAQPGATAEAATATTATEPATTQPDDVAVRAPSLTWSAHPRRGRRGGIGALTPTAGLVAATVAAAVATAVAAGLGLP